MIEELEENVKGSLDEGREELDLEVVALDSDVSLEVRVEEFLVLDAAFFLRGVAADHEDVHCIEVLHGIVEVENGEVRETREDLLEDPYFLVLNELVYTVLEAVSLEEGFQDVEEAVDLFYFLLREISDLVVLADDSLVVDQVVLDVLFAV